MTAEARTFVALLAAGVALRVCLILAGSPSFLLEWSEFSTPADSFEALSESAFRSKAGLPQYDDGVVHFPPLVIAAAAALGPAVFPYLNVAADVAVACMIRSLAALWPGAPSSLLPAFLLLNPVLILGAASGSTSALSRFLAVAALWVASAGGKTFYAAAVAAVAAYVNPSYLALVVPVCFAAGGHTASGRRAAAFSPPRAVCVVAGFAIAAWALLALSRAAHGSYSFLGPVYGWRWAFTDLSPTIGLAWYFFAEVLRFGPYYRLVLAVFPLSFLAPLCLWFRAKPVFLFALVFAITSLFQPFPTLPDVSLSAALLTLQPRVDTLLPLHSAVLLLVMMSVSLFLPVMRVLWLGPGSGNANFYFIQGMLHTIAASTLVGYFVHAGVKLDKLEQQEAEKLKSE